jgi:hypothetical protein
VERSRAEPDALKLAPAPPTTRPVLPAGSLAASLIALQRAAGNQATSELVREIQARDGRAASLADRPSLRILDQLRVQRAVASWAGEWDTLRYKTTKDAATGKTPVGVDIAIEFRPGDKVDATGIGIIQGVVSADKGAPLAVNPETGTRSLTKGAMKGFHIDQLPGFINPLYPSTAGKAGDELGTTPVLPMKTPGGGRHGWRFVDKKGTEQKLSAQMNDLPALDPHGANAKQIFETTAMAFSGHQAGTYYGSVTWGWQTNAKGKFSRIPFALLSNDVPTGTFAAAAGLWNATKTAAGAAHLRLPMGFGRWTNRDDSVIVKNPAKAVDTELAKVVKNTRVEVTSNGPGEKFNKGKDKWSKITVTEGPQIGLVGWTLRGDLADKKVP